MPSSLSSASAAFAVTPSRAAAGRLGWARGALAACLGVLVAGFLTRWIIGPGSEFHPALPWLMAPVGASAVLVFVFPASPLAQPWPVVGGSLIPAVLGLAIHALVPEPLIAGAIALAAAIMMMTLARCLHPPGGACALLAAMGWPAADTLGWQALILPLAANVVIIVAMGLLLNTLTGHRYPHHPKPGPVLAPGTWAGSYTDEDLDAVLEEWDEVLDVSREDLDALFRQVERRVQRKWLERHTPS